ncbi:unnamed protein product [Gongylonema pulchrum]|uniref:TAFII55_N domain-containing protein n=1 Tax=Gongylonema pulchrum TaxID=637853 RepID=A0A183EV23_9BILA|nr:unnamed protein product [Gongylonema pulchrum]
MRHVGIRFQQQVMSAKLYDLPCIVEVMKTVDKKNVYKVTDLSQILICSHDVEPFTSASSSPRSDISKIKRDKVMKTVDKKNVYKVTDLSQILICSHDVEPFTSASSSPRSDISKIKRDKVWQWPHGLTPPMKSVRKRRFRKTKKKKYLDAPDIERELKRLLRADIEATSSRWEVCLF